MVTDPYISITKHMQEHHVTGTHEWVTDEGGVNKSGHTELPLATDKPLLGKGSSPPQSTPHIYLLFLKTIPYFLNFRSNAVCENVNILVLKYTSKMIAYKYDAYRARYQLAATAYQMHKDCPLKKDCQECNVMWTQN